MKIVHIEHIFESDIDLFQGARIECLSNRDKLISIVSLIPSPLLNPFQGSLELDSVGLLFQFCIGAYYIDLITRSGLTWLSLCIGHDKSYYHPHIEPPPPPLIPVNERTGMVYFIKTNKRVALI